MSRSRSATTAFEEYGSLKESNREAITTRAPPVSPVFWLPSSFKNTLTADDRIKKRKIETACDCVATVVTHASSLDCLLMSHSHPSQ